jgi:hypothetical protein
MPTDQTSMQFLSGAGGRVSSPGFKLLTRPGLMISLADNKPSQSASAQSTPTALTVVTHFRNEPPEAAVHGST